MKLKFNLLVYELTSWGDYILYCSVHYVALLMNLYKSSLVLKSHLSELVNCQLKHHDNMQNKWCDNDLFNEP